MRKYVYLILASVLSWTVAHAQPTMSYEFKSKSGTYQEITGGTVIGSKLLGAELNEVVYFADNIACKEVKTAPGFPIGFNFVFSNQVMNQFAIGTNGYLILGKDQVTLAEAKSSFHSAGGSKNTNVISSVSMGEISGNANTELSYKVLGTAPSRILVIQYKNLDLMDRWGDNLGATAQLQFRLYETSNKIDIIYKDWKTENSTLSLRLGIKGSITDDLLLLKLGENRSWAENFMTSSDTGTTMSWGKDCYPADGLTCTFTPPADCAVPNIQPTGFTLKSSSISVEGNFKKAQGADHYLILMNESATLSKLPENGVFYKANDKLGDALVIAYDTASVFKTPETLVGAKTYYFYVFGANSFCMYGPKYNTNTPLAGTIITKPAQPDALTIVAAGMDQMTLNAKGNAAGDKVLIAVTAEPGTSDFGDILADGAFGQPSGILNSGDAIEGGGTVVYKGEAKDGIVATGLLDNTVYHFKSWSFNGEDNYSTVGTTANDVTWGKVPFIPDFSKMPTYEAPIGWPCEGGIFRLANDYTDDAALLECNIQSGDPTNGKINSVTTPWILLSEGINRVVFNYNMSEWSRAGTTPYNNWDERDVFEVQVSKDGTTFETVYQVTKDKNTPKFATATSYVKTYAAFDKYAGEKVKIRVYWKCYKGIKLLLRDFMVEEKAACDYPINLAVDKASLTGGQAKISWVSQSEENMWDVRYRVAGAEEWGAPFEVNSNPYLVTNMPTLKDIELQVRAKCSMASQSAWSETLSFRTGYGVPFTETFSGITVLPEGWNFESGTLANPTVFCTENCTKQWTWKGSRGKYGIYLYSMLATTDDWVLSPSVDLGDGSVNYIFNFELSMTGLQESNDESYSIVISKDGGKTFSSVDVLKTIAKADLPANGENKTFSASLKGYKGLVRLGIYVKSTTGAASMVQLTSVSVTESCPSDAVATVSDVTEDGAKVTWEGTADSWLVFSRQAGSKVKDYKVQTAKELVLNDLQPRTAYEVGITKMCAVGDTAKVVIASFTTLSLAPCELVTDVKVVPSQYGATISWTGDAMSYNLRYRVKGATEWVIKNTTELSYIIEGLEPEKEYEYGIQAVCSSAAGDASEWTETAVFRTLAITCFPPTNVKVKPTHKSAVVTWEGEADKYEVSYCKGAEAWISSEATAYTVTLESLDPQTAYKVRVRSICSATDMSKWSSVVEFTTTAVPDCVAPSNLVASNAKEATVDLAWDADASNLTWDLRYRPGSVTSWTTVKELSDKKYSLENLTANTAYIWSVKATCDEGRTSAWASQGEFKTVVSGIQSTDYSSLKVFVSNKVLNVINAEHVWVKQLQIYSMNGQLMGTYPLNTDENILLPMAQNNNQVVVKISGDNWTRSYIVVFK